MLSRIFAPNRVSSKLCNLSPLQTLKSSGSDSLIPTVNKRWGSGGFVPSDMPHIKQKWYAADKVGQICESMKNVAAGALPGCERHLANSRPFGSVTLPFFQVEKEPEGIVNVMHLLIGTERGMCGAIAGNGVRQARANVEKNPKLNHKAVCYGKRTASVANTLFGADLQVSFVESAMKVPTFELCCHIAEYLLYEASEWDKVIFYYNEYENAVRFYSRQVSIYKEEIALAIAELQFPNYEIEAEEGIIIGSLIEWKLASEIYLYLAENGASEQAARLQSMDGAVKNCNEMVNEYERIYQGLRKSKITNDLILMSGCIKLALAGKK